MVRLRGANNKSQTKAGVQQHHRMHVELAQHGVKLGFSAVVTQEDAHSVEMGQPTHHSAAQDSKVTRSAARGGGGGIKK